MYFAFCLATYICLHCLTISILILKTWWHVFIRNYTIKRCYFRSRIHHFVMVDGVTLGWHNRCTGQPYVSRPAIVSPTHGRGPSYIILHKLQYHTLYPTIQEHVWDVWYPLDSPDQHTREILNTVSWNSEQKWPNDLEDQGQWPPFSIPSLKIPRCIFGANLVMLT